MSASILRPRRDPGDADDREDPGEDAAEDAEEEAEEDAEELDDDADAGACDDGSCGSPTVEVADRQTRLPIDPGEVIDLVRHALAAEDAGGSIEVAFVDDAMIAELHERFLGVAGPTDVITFPYGDDGAGLGDRVALGEIVVSTDTALRQAPEYGSDPVAEAYLYVVHGVLHLLGWDDGEDGAADRMAARQREILDEWLEERGGE